MTDETPKVRVAIGEAFKLYYEAVQEQIEHMNLRIENQRLRIEALERRLPPDA